MAPSDRHEPSYRMLTMVIMFLAFLGVITMGCIKLTSAEQIRAALSKIGVGVQRITRAGQEIERKTFHIAGLVVPLIHMVLLDHGFSNYFCASICWCITISGWAFEILRLHIPALRQAVMNSFMGSILRKEEHHQVTGSVYFSLGCTLAISLFPPGVAMTSILYLVLGDLSAALIGISFGGDYCIHKIGRQGKKSVEGSVAMFVVCFFIGCFVYNEVHLAEYAVFVSALVATLTELWEPFGLNDNLTIPVFSSLALTWGLMRIHSCTNEPIEMFRSVPNIWEALYNASDTLGHLGHLNSMSTPAPTAPMAQPVRF